MSNLAKRIEKLEQHESGKHAVLFAVQDQDQGELYECEGKSYTRAELQDLADARGRELTIIVIERTAAPAGTFPQK